MHWCDGSQEEADALLARAQAAGLRGTLLVAPEGLNLFLAGQEQAVRGFVQALRAELEEAHLSLDDPGAAAPDSVIWTDSAPGWAEIDRRLVASPGQPVFRAAD